MHFYKSMKNLIQQLAKNRLLRHLGYWCAYVLFFTLIWGTYDGSYFKNLVIQLSGLPSRLILVYITIYYLFSKFYDNRNYLQFLLSYLVLLLCVSIVIQRPTMLYFVQPNFLPDWQNSPFFKITELFNTTLDVNIAAIIPVIYRIIKSDRNINKRVVEYERKDKLNASLQSAFIQLKVEKTIIKLAIKDIVYIESLKNYIKVNMVNEAIVVYKSLSALEKELSTSKFLRIHRSFIIGIDYLDSFSPSKVTVNKTELPVGRKYKEDVKSVLNYE